MSTAICRIYTHEGFVIAADGRMRKLDDDGHISVLSETTQKIFCIQGPGRVIAYSITGSYAITPDHSEEVVFDFVTEAARVAQYLSTAKPKSLFRYAEILCAKLVS